MTGLARVVAGPIPSIRIAMCLPRLREARPLVGACHTARFGPADSFLPSIAVFAVQSAGIQPSGSRDSSVRKSPFLMFSFRGGSFPSPTAIVAALFAFCSSREYGRTAAT
jgi:hypothetical protein